MTAKLTQRQLLPSFRATRWLVLSLLFAWLLFSSPNVHAQELQRSLGTSSGITANPLLEMRQQFSASALDVTTLPLEGAVDPSQYRVGPGDTFGITLGSAEAGLLPLVVTADGMVLIPGNEPISVADALLQDAKLLILAALQDQYQNVAVNVALLQPRRFYVHVVGSVSVPGRYPASAVTRVSDVLELAYADTSRIAVTNLAYRPALRNVEIRRSTGASIPADIARYLSTGDTNFNPYLYDGDVVFVPAYDPALGSVYVDGAVAFPGSYDLRPEDTVADLIALATGVTAPPLLPVRLTRMQIDGTATTIVLSMEEARATELQANDHIAIVQRQPSLGHVTVRGQVQYPGTFPIVRGETTLNDILQMAGGVLDNAMMQAAYIERMPGTTDALRLLPPAERTGTSMESSLLAAIDTLATFRQIRLANLDFFSRTYLLQEVLAHNRVAVNLWEAQAPNAPAVYMQNEDLIVIPRDTRSVMVVGQIHMPGFQPWHRDHTVATYVEAAGGLSEASGSIYVIKAGTKALIPAVEAKVESGDIIFIDRIEDAADSASLERLTLEYERLRVETDRIRTEDRFRRTQLVLQALGTVASSIALILSISNQ